MEKSQKPIVPTGGKFAAIFIDEDEEEAPVVAELSKPSVPGRTWANIVSQPPVQSPSDEEPVPNAELNKQWLDSRFGSMMHLERPPRRSIFERSWADYDSDSDSE